MTDNLHFDFVGGVIECIPAGSMNVVDETTGQPKRVEWPNHVRVISKLARAKLNGQACLGLIGLADNEEFRAWVNQCR